MDESDDEYIFELRREFMISKMVIDKLKKMHPPNHIYIKALENHILLTQYIINIFSAKGISYDFIL